MLLFILGNVKSPKVQYRAIFTEYCAIFLCYCVNYGYRNKERLGMIKIKDFYNAIMISKKYISLNELLTLFPTLKRRTAQRWLLQLINEKKIKSSGNARSRLYSNIDETKPAPLEGIGSEHRSDPYPDHMPLSADSRDILNYINKPQSARKPVGYQREFLNTYFPNKTFYLSENLRRMLHNMGKTDQLELPAGTYGRSILNRLLIDLSWASSNLEGNTYSRLDTVELITHGKTADGKNALETQMILNHKSAIELLVQNAESIGFNKYTILNLHSALAENILPNPADEGRIRNHLVGIGASVYHPISGADHINEILDEILIKADEITDPFEQSFFIMVHLPYLQPFSDVNKITSRLVANLPLIKANLCPLTFIDVPIEAYSRATLGVYELTRIELLRDLYIWAYERSTQEYLAITQELAKPDPLRLKYRDLIKSSIHKIVCAPQKDELEFIEQIIEELQSGSMEEKNNIKSLIIEELRRLHEGVLARYNLRPSEFERWKENRMN